MLPPPFHPGAKVLFDNSRNGGGTTTIDRRPKSRASSTASAASSTSGTTRKQAPPVPKKPMLLSKPSGPKDPNASNGTNNAPSHGGTLAGHEKAAVLPAPLRTDAGIARAFRSSQRTSASPPSATGRQHDGSLDDDGPPLPPRRATGNSSYSRGLMDEDDEGARAIPSLQPQRRC